MNILVKPVSESDGNLVILADNTQELYLVDVTTGELVEGGTNRGASNGRESTFRFRQPGGSYQNVGLMDDQGNIVLTLASAGDRVQFNYEDYDALVETPVSTIDGYRFDNTKNQESIARGGPSNADIAKSPSEMTTDEYITSLETQKAQQAQAGISGAGAAGLVGSGIAAAAPSIIEGGGLGEAGVMAGVNQGPLTAGQASTLQATGAIAPIAGGAAGTYLVGKGVKDLIEGETDNSTEGKASRGQTALTTGGLSEVARLSGFGDRKSTQDYQRERVEGVLSGENNPGGAAPGFADFLSQSREVADKNNDTWQEGKYKGQKWDFDKALDLAKKDPGQFIGVLGNAETLGDEFLGIGEEKQKETVSKFIDEDLYFSNKGDVLIADEDQDRAREIFNEVMGGSQQQGSNPTPVPSSPKIPPSEVFSEGAQPRALVQDVPGTEPPISDFEQIDGGSLSPPEGPADSLAALNFVQSAPSQILASQLSNEIFADDRARRDSRLSFEQLQRAFE